MRELCARFDCSRFTIHRWIKSADFPHGRKVAGLKGLRWDEIECNYWALTHGVQFHSLVTPE